MILTCENCLKRYLVPDRSISMAGRQVRCVACGHEWFQEPPAVAIDITKWDELPRAQAAAELPDLEPIPEAVKPLPEGSNVPAVIATEKAARHGGRVTGYIAAAAVFFIILAGLLVLREPLSMAWPPSNAFFTALGLPTALPGDGLSIDDVTTADAPNAQGLPVLTIHGKITNHRSAPVILPPLEAQLCIDNAQIFDHWRIELTQRSVPAHGELAFTTNYPAAPKNANGVVVRFLLPN